MKDDRARIDRPVRRALSEAARRLSQHGAQLADIGARVDDEDAAAERNETDQVPDLVDAAGVARRKAAQVHEDDVALADEPREHRCQVSARQKKLLTRYQPSRSGARSRCAICASSVRASAMKWLASRPETKSSS